MPHQKPPETQDNSENRLDNKTDLPYVFHVFKPTEVLMAQFI